MDQVNMFFFKSVLSVVLVLSAFAAMFTMFETLGRTEKRYDTARLKLIHRMNGLFFLSLFAFISYFCLDYMVSARADLSPRGIFHAVFSLSVIILLALKITFLRFYRQFYSMAKTLGLLIALLTFGMAGTSGGYFLLVTKFGTQGVRTLPPAKTAQSVEKPPAVKIHTDPQHIRKGRELYESKCYSCHDPDSTETIVGPGHKNILKNPELPVSKKEATPENIAEQIRNPISAMPAFAYLTDEEIADIIAYMNTL